MAWSQPSSKSHRLLFWSLAILAVVMVLVVAFALRRFNREMNTAVSRSVQQGVPPHAEVKMTQESPLFREEAPATVDGVAGVRPSSTVGISDATAFLSDDSLLKVNFTLSSSSGSQSGVRYGILLLRKTDSGFVTDDQFFPEESVNLPEGVQFAREVEYRPKALSGLYTVVVSAESQNSLPLSQAFAGDVSFTHRDDPASIFVDPTSCSMGIQGDTKRFAISQGVDIASSEKASISCEISDRSKSDWKNIGVSANFYRRGIAGPKVDSVEGVENISIEGSQKGSGDMRISFDIPGLKVPQAYSMVFWLSDKTSSKALSNALESHFVIRGASSTVQNVVLDRNFYSAGSTAKISLLLSPSADSFLFGSRSQGTDIGKVNLQVSLQQKDDETLCALPLDRVIGRDDMGQIVVSVLVNRDCRNPEVVASISKEGVSLDKQRFFAESGGAQDFRDENVSEAVSNSTGKTSSSARVALVVLGALLAAVAVVFVSSKALRGRKGNSPLSMFLAVLAGALLFMGAPSSRALAAGGSFTVRGGPFEESPGNIVNFPDVSFTGNLNKTDYSPGESMLVSGSAHLEWCTNGYVVGDLYASLNGTGPYVQLVDSQKGSAGSTLFGSTFFSAPTTTGSYFVRFRGNISAVFSGYYDVPFNVVNPPACGPNNNKVFTGAGPTGGNSNYCSVGSPVGIAGTEPAGTNPLALHNPTNSSAWVGWDWTCGGSTVCVACLTGYVRSGNTCVSSAPTTYTLNVSASGASGVPISGVPSTYGGTTNYSKTGIPSGTSITLTAPPTVGTATFTGWSGSCTGTGSCSFVMNLNKSVIANYSAPTLSVAVTATPNSGNAPLNSTVKAVVAGTATGNINYTFNCGNGTTQSFPNETVTTKSFVCSYSTAGSYVPTVSVVRQGITANGSAPVTVGSGFACTGSVPASAVKWDAEEETGLLANSPWVYADPDTSIKCQYHCLVGTWDPISSSCSVSGICSNPQDHCPDETWDDSLGNHVCTGGTKDCRQHWIEVNP